MICDNCTKKNKCTKIISVNETYCLDKTTSTGTRISDYKRWGEALTKDYLNLVDPYNSDTLQKLVNAVNVLMNNRRW